MHTHTRHQATAEAAPYVGDQAQFSLYNSLATVQLQAFRSGNDVTVQCSFPRFPIAPILSANLSNNNPTGSINSPEFAMSMGGNPVRYSNLQVALQANYNGTSPTSVYAALQIDVSVGSDREPCGTVGANYVLGF